VVDKELVVVDTGLRPSPFFSSLTDARVKYHHLHGRGDALTVGAKRNRAVTLASGEFVAHFDDDDLYAPPYLEEMLRAMQEGAAHAVKLRSWYTLDVASGICGKLDANAGLPQPLEGSRQRGLFTHGYGFSFVYRREVALRVPFYDTTWGEDLFFAYALEEAGVPVAWCSDKDFVCLHIQHADNLSRSIAQRLVPTKKWKVFVVQLQRHMLGHIGQLAVQSPPVLLASNYESADFISADVRKAIELSSTSAEEVPLAPPPGGLFVCSLYDEYYRVLEAQGLEDHQRTAGPDLADPVVAWCGQPTVGMRALPTREKDGVLMAPDPLKPREDLREKLGIRDIFS